MVVRSKTAQGDFKNVDYANKEKNSIHFFIDGSNPIGTLVLNTEIPSQTIRLVGQRIKFIAAQGPYPSTVYVVLDPNSFGPQQLINNLGQSMLPIFYDSAVIDSVTNIEFSISLSKKLSSTLKYRICDKNGTTIANNIIDFIQLIWEYEVDVINS